METKYWITLLHSVSPKTLRTKFDRTIINSAILLKKKKKKRISVMKWINYRGSLRQPNFTE